MWSVPTHRAAVQNERGVALAMVLILSAIILAVIAGLIYIITSGTQITGMQKRYKTALEAGLGGNDVMYQVISLRGDVQSLDSLKESLSSLDLEVVTPSTCVTQQAIPDCTAIGNYTGLAAKLNLPTRCWSNCDSSLTIDPTNNPFSYDVSLQLPGSFTTPTYSVYAKVVDTVLGNSGGEEGLLKHGVVSSGSGDITVVSVPYLYTIEVEAENADNPSERAKLSVLYQY